MVCLSFPASLPHEACRSASYGSVGCLICCLGLPRFPVFHVALDGGGWIAGLRGDLVAGQAMIGVEQRVDDCSLFRWCRATLLQWKDSSVCLSAASSATPFFLTTCFGCLTLTGVSC